MDRGRRNSRFQHETGRGRQKRFQSFNVPPGILDCLFGWCAAVAKSAGCGIKKNPEVGSCCEALRSCFQKSDVGEEEDGDKEKDRVEIFSHG